MTQKQMQPANTHYALIMAGGEGTRFAPLSTPEKPKQFLNLLDSKKTLLQQTYDRLSKMFAPENILVATNARYVPLVLEQLPALKPEQIFGETRKKNTAPCLAWASFQLFQKNKKAVVVAIPADQFIAPEEAFLETIAQAFTLAEEEQAIVTIGIKPTFPSTQHGYLHTEGKKVKEFVEKPDAPTAAKFFKDNNYSWNGGTFIFPVAKMITALKEHLPEMFSLLTPTTTLADFFEKTPSISIDYGVMEKRKDLLTVQAPFTWSDVGTWESLAQLAKEYSLNLSPEVISQIQKQK